MQISRAQLRCSSIADFRAVAQPPEHSPAITDVVYRAGSIYLSIPLARLRVTPNAITIGWIVLGLVGIGAVAVDSWSVRLAGALLLQLSYLLDYVDGEVARLTERRSRAGELLDLIGHGFHKVTLPLAVGWSASGAGATPALLVAGVVGAATIVVGDNLRFYAACVAGELGSGDLGHTVRHREGLNGLTVRRVLRTAFLLSFESPGLYALTVLAAIFALWTPLALYWAGGGIGWVLYRTVIYCARVEGRAA
jgi:phosphatidylglycerophosphate synthase